MGGRFFLNNNCELDSSNRYGGMSLWLKYLSFYDIKCTYIYEYLIAILRANDEKKHCYVTSTSKMVHNPWKTCVVRGDKGPVPAVCHNELTVILQDGDVTMSILHANTKFSCYWYRIWLKPVSEMMDAADVIWIKICVLDLRLRPAAETARRCRGC